MLKYSLVLWSKLLFSFLLFYKWYQRVAFFSYWLWPCSLHVQCTDLEGPSFLYSHINQSPAVCPFFIGYEAESRGPPDNHLAVLLAPNRSLVGSRFCTSKREGDQLHPGNQARPYKVGNGRWVGIHQVDDEGHLANRQHVQRCRHENHGPSAKSWACVGFGEKNRKSSCALLKFWALGVVLAWAVEPDCTAVNPDPTAACFCGPGPVSQLLCLSISLFKDAEVHMTSRYHHWCLWALCWVRSHWAPIHAVHAGQCSVHDGFMVSADLNVTHDDEHIYIMCGWWNHGRLEFPILIPF